jgi:hypothetical protein
VEGSTRGGRWRVAAAAAGAVAVGASAWLATRGGSPGGSDGGTDAALVAAARALTDARPDLFAGFAPLGPGERRAARPDAARPRLVLRYPAGTIVGTTPTFSWSEVPGADAYEVTLFSKDGTRLFARKAKEPRLPHPDPPLEAGARYVWEVIAKVPGGPEHARRPFAVASEGERARFADAKAEIDARVEPRLRALVLAHWALRGDLVEAARDAARQAAADRPLDDVAAETLAHVRRRLGDEPPR